MPVKVTVAPAVADEDAPDEMVADVQGWVVRLNTMPATASLAPMLLRVAPGLLESRTQTPSRYAPPASGPAVLQLKVELEL